MAREMSDTELRHRQKIQGKIARTTSTLGLGGLAVTGAGVLAHKNTGALKAIQKIPKMKGATPQGMKNAAINTGIVSGGIGGVGGFNQASIYSAESKRRKQATPMAKSLGMEMGYFGEEGHALTTEEIDREISKADTKKPWHPMGSRFDSEKSRMNRSRAYEGAAIAGGLGATHIGLNQAVKTARTAKKEFKPRIVEEPIVTHVPYTTSGGKKAHRKKTIHTKPFKAMPLTKEAVKAVRKPAGKAGLALGAAGAAFGGAHAIHQKRKGSWQPYAKNYEIEKLSREQRGAVGGAVGGVFGPVGSATASGIIAPKGKKVKHAAIGAGAGLAGPVGGAASGYYAASAHGKKKKVSKSAFGVDHE
jgi:hypothetical protein